MAAKKFDLATQSIIKCVRTHQRMPETCSKMDRHAN